MAFSTPYTFTALELLTAAKMNAIQANITAIWVGTTAGDMEYYTGATAKARLAPPAGVSLMQHNGTAPSYVAAGNSLKLLRMNLAGDGFEFGNASIGTAIHYDATGSTYNGSGRDLPNSSASIVTAVTCTIIMAARVLAACGTGNCWADFACNIGGVPGNYSSLRYSTGIGVPVVAYYLRTGVAAGTITLKISEKEGYGSGVTYTVSHLEWIALAIPE